MINQSIAVGNVVKVQLSGFKYEYIHFATAYSSKVQFGKQLPPLMLMFPSCYHEQLLLSRTH